MNISILTSDYISRFPTKLHDYLKKDSNKEVFARKVIDNYGSIRVYRGIHEEGTVTVDDFICNLDEKERSGKKLRTKDLNSMPMYSVSVNEDKQQLIATLSIPNKHGINGIAVGYMRAKYGPADFNVKEGVQLTHHNWYLFNNCREKVCNEFKSISI